MRFQDWRELASIIGSQAEGVMLCDTCGAPQGELSPAAAAELVARTPTAGWSGTGHRRRVRYIQPARGIAGLASWRGGSHTTVKVPARNAAGDAISEPRHEHRLLRFFQ
jgi:hypothetical protein